MGSATKTDTAMITNNWPR